jgi:chromosome segregation protein
VGSQRSRLNTWHRELAEHHTQKENISRERAVIEERIRSMEKRIQDLDTEMIRLEEHQALANDRLENTREEQKSGQDRYQEAEEKAKVARETLLKKNQQITSLEELADSAQKKLTSFLEKEIQLRSQLSDRKDQLEKKNSRLTSAKEQVNTVQEDLKAVAAKYNKVKNDLQKAEKSRQKIEIEILDIQQEKIAGEKYRQEEFDHLSEIKTKKSQLSAELLVLQQAEQKLSGYADGAKLLLSKSGSGKLPGVLGTLSKYIDVPEELEIPLASVLGEYLDAVIVEKASDANKALELLVDEATKGVLLPLNRLVTLDRLKTNQNIPGFIGIASELVKTSPKYRPVVDLLLGRVFVLKDKKDIYRVLRDQPVGTKAVTLKGEVFYSTGEVITGNAGQSGILSRSRKLKSWQDDIAELDELINTIEGNIKRIDGKLNDYDRSDQDQKNKLDEARKQEYDVKEIYDQVSLERNSAENQVEWETSQYQSLVDEISEDESLIKTISADLDNIQDEISDSQQLATTASTDLRKISLEEERKQLNHWETELAVTERALTDLNQRLEEREIAWQEATQLVDDNRNLKDQLQKQIKNLLEETSFLEDGENTIQNEITELRILIDETDGKLLIDEEDQRSLQAKEADARRVLNQAERSYAQADINLTRNREKLETIQERIKEDIGLVEFEYDKDISGPTPLPLDGYVQKLPVVKEISKNLGSTIREQRAQLRRLGAINPEAQREYREVNERHEFLTEQLSDLRKAEADLKEVIAELDVLMEREFRKTFNAVASEFKEIFTQLFGGGKGQLTLTEPDDLTGSGVDIQVRLPGRRVQGLSLLSGGERSLIAAALIFALLKISPTPFCVLDEVDAMLDESNVARYRKLLRELSSDTQFIVITHNRNTVQVADVIYGIIMSSDSSSQVLSLKLDEVDDVIDN